MITAEFREHIELQHPTLYAGCMTGTSADAFADFTIACFDPQGQPRYHANLPIEMPHRLRQRLHYLSEMPFQQLSRTEIQTTEKQLSDFLTNAYTHAIAHWELKGYPKNQLVLSPHGQTVYHQPTHRLTQQLLNAQQIHTATGYPIVHGHRTACIAVSNAAPLAPLLLQKILSHDNQCNIIINGGGIANITVMNPSSAVPLTGFDIGPANGPLDSLIQYHLHHQPGDLPEQVKQQQFDVDGELSRSGQLIHSLYRHLKSHPYFTLPVNKKSADRSTFNLDWIGQQYLDKHDVHDLGHTISRVISDTIIDAITCHLSNQLTNQISFYGGLLHNTYIMERIENHFQSIANVTLYHLNDFGFNPDFIESLLMAYLGFCVHQRKSVDLSYCSNSENAFCIPGSLLQQSSFNHTNLKNPHSNEKTP